MKAPERTLSAVRHEYLAALILLLGLALYAGNVARHRERYWDDAFITFRFASHLARGVGLVWNIGGDRVEGYTSFLHVLVLAAASRAGIPPEQLTITLGVACSIATATLLVWAVRRWAGRLTAVAAIPIALYLADEPTAVHSTSGLETPLFVLLLATAGVAAFRLMEAPGWRPAIALGVTLWLAILGRPEGGLFGAALLTVLLAKRRTWRFAVLAGSLASILTAMYLAWKYAYFGYWLPNSYYVKSNRLSLSGFTPTGQFVRHEILRLGPLVLMALALGVAAGRQMTAFRDVRAIVALLLLPTVVGLAYYVTILHEVGGSYRFTFPVIAFVTLAAACCSLALTEGRNTSPAPLVRRRVVEPLMASFGVALLLIGQPGFEFSAMPRGAFNDYHMKIATALRSSGLSETGTIICDGAGVIPYVSGFSMLDRVGLTDNVLAGRKPLTPAQREQYLWSRDADVYIGYEPPASAGAVSPATDPRMQTWYVDEILLDRPLSGIGDRIFVQDPDLLHARMRELRDRWEWIGEIEWPGWSIWQLKSFVYIRKGADRRLHDPLRQIVVRPPSEVTLDDLTTVTKNR